MARAITSVKGREIFDSRGNPTVAVQVSIGENVYKAMVPSGASTGVHEALELRDGGARLNGKGVLRAVENINGPIAKKLEGMDPLEQAAIDQAMLDLDGTPNKAKLGANATVGVSMAVCRAGAGESGVELYEYIGKLYGCDAKTLPIPQFNVINGGKHAGMENDIQENMYMPYTEKSFKDALVSAAESYQALRKNIKKRFGARCIQLGDEGGFVPPIEDPKERLDAMMQACEDAGHKALPIAIDAASSEFYYAKEGVYKIGEKSYDAAALTGFWDSLTSDYPIVSLEDGMSEDDWGGWTALTEKVGGRIQITGDDLLVTNVVRIKKAIEMKACNSLLLKVNQIGTITESLAAARMAQDDGWDVTVSHRSGETEDPFIADLAVGIGASQIKTGAPARSERLAKYNRLLEIEEKLGKQARYAGSEFKQG